MMIRQVYQRMLMLDILRMMNQDKHLEQHHVGQRPPSILIVEKIQTIGFEMLMKSKFIKDCLRIILSYLVFNVVSCHYHCHLQHWT
jgi:hypothetical protein